MLSRAMMRFGLCGKIDSALTHMTISLSLSLRNRIGLMNLRGKSF